MATLREKIEAAKEIISQRGGCIDVDCNLCPGSFNNTSAGLCSATFGIVDGDNKINRDKKCYRWMKDWLAEHDKEETMDAIAVASKDKPYGFKDMVTNCYFQKRADDHTPALFWDDGEIVRCSLDGYAIIPLDYYHSMVSENTRKERKEKMMDVWKDAPEGAVIVIDDEGNRCMAKGITDVYPGSNGEWRTKSEWLKGLDSIPGDGKLHLERRPEKREDIATSKRLEDMRMYELIEELDKRYQRKE